ncbi:hypothetical protein H310_14763 [Aphanomyces invadans]|uniref:Uncharacterized protein n=1 Tax=Aphanomyces invadans TaxID=157072 RepID=A0A024T8Z4_9STRA|nr:hypothetical protein H310_14763 [Aphanomyces invadans]ETV90439.1 hypothetical protein H310_14763 [Aphanomyces invadans]|eukprot:XP_008880913.1 hypothetical protein H310_14763 [Aphanomyces invadans]
MSCSHPGSVHDLTILHLRQAIQKAMLEKTPEELLRPDHGELSTQARPAWNPPKAASSEWHVGC